MILEEIVLDLFLITNDPSRATIFGWRTDWLPVRQWALVEMILSGINTNKNWKRLKVLSKNH